MNSTKPTSFELIRYISARCTQILYLNYIPSPLSEITRIACLSARKRPSAKNTYGTKLGRLAGISAITNRYWATMRDTLDTRVKTGSTLVEELSFHPRKARCIHIFARRAPVDIF